MASINATCQKEKNHMSNTLVCQRDLAACVFYVAYNIQTNGS